MAQAQPFAVGLNCALGASDMQPYIDNLSKCADCYVFAYPNAGLPNAMGGYDQKASYTSTPPGLAERLADPAVGVFVILQQSSWAQGLTVGPGVAALNPDLSCRFALLTNGQRYHVRAG